MPNTNINKFAAFVILLAAGVLTQTGCGFLSPSGAAQNNSYEVVRYGSPVATGALQSDDLREASGVAASKCQTDVYWTHNDSGDGPLVYAINGKGEHLGVWKITDARNKDWEDIAAIRDAAGGCSIIVGDIGNNELKRDDLTVYRFGEPAVSADSRDSSKAEPLAGPAAGSLLFSYPDSPQDAEALLVHPSTGDIYVLTKSRNAPSGVFKIKSNFDGSSQTAVSLAEIKVPAVPNGTVTGGDISPDGRRLVLCDYFAGYELTLPEDAASFDEIWSQKPVRIDLGEREIGEAVAYTRDGSAVIALSEKRHTPVIIVERIAK
jgi:hypothetical protein